ncbi:hypothetical protein [Microvirga alba]|nr:hypothetical protein [Microvirga alba]
MSEVYAAGSISLRQSLGLSRIELSREYDVVLAGLSWEKRASTALSAVAQRVGPLKLLKFRSVDQEAEDKKNATLETFRALDWDLEVLDFERSTDFGANADRFERLLRDLYVQKGRPLKILVDVTCLPKSYILFLFGCGFKRDYVSRLDCVYAEGAYSLHEDHASAKSPEQPGTASGIISEGEWQSLQVPYLEAESAMPMYRDLIVAMGGEVGLSVPLIEKYEPRRLGLILIQESLVQEPDKLVPSERAALLSLLSESNVQRSNVPLCDVLSLTKFAIEFCRSSSSDNVTGLAIGSKPHALALALAALSEDKMEVICRVPTRYRQLDVAPTGTICLYELDDRFEPTSYF